MYTNGTVRHGFPDPIYGTGDGDSTGGSIDISSQGDILAVCSRKALNEYGEKTGRTDIYEWNDSSWVSRRSYYNDILGSVILNISLSSAGDVLGFSGYSGNDGQLNAAGGVKRIV